jgi:phosphatidylglycerol lysyltransferase
MEIDRLRELVRAHGWNSTVAQLLNPGFDYWVAADGDAAAGYIEHGRWWVVAGAPVAAPDRFETAVAELEQAARARQRRLIYVAAERRLEGLLSDERRWARLLLGAQPLFDPALWPATLAGHASLRAQLHRARNKGTRVEEWAPERAGRDPGLRRCLEQWLTRRGLPPLLFLTTPWTLGTLTEAGRRIFVAERGGEPVGFLLASPAPARRWALVEQLVRGDAAPNGTGELLIDAAFRALAGSVDRITLGLAPLSGRSGDWSGAPVWLRAAVAWARAHGRRFYNFSGLESFKAKLGPLEWEPVWLVASGPRIGPSALWAMLAAFAGGHPVRFAARALTRAVGRELAGRR